MKSYYSTIDCGKYWPVCVPLSFQSQTSHKSKNERSKVFLHSFCRSSLIYGRLSNQYISQESSVVVAMHILTTTFLFIGLQKNSYKLNFCETLQKLYGGIESTFGPPS